MLCILQLKSVIFAISYIAIDYNNHEWTIIAQGNICNINDLQTFLRLEETYCHSNSSEKLLANSDVKNSEGVNNNNNLVYF